MANPTAHVLRFGDFELDVRAGELRKFGLRVKLQDQSFQILWMLLENPGEVVLREEIRKKLWPNNTIVEFDHSINAAIKRLRNSLGESAEEPRYIETLARRGYRFVGQVENAGPAAAPEAAEPVEFYAEEESGARTVAHYRLMEKLGSGAMGVVYRAEDLKLGRHVAVKFLPGELADRPAARQRFEQEARAASALNHPNICAIYGLEDFDGRAAIVMELVEGETLEARLSQGPLPLNRALALSVQIASALDEAHRKGIVHRDLKPSNIMLTRRSPSGVIVKVLDFGIAKMEPPEGRAAAGNATEPGIVVGTWKYMSPEQSEGKKTDSRSDIYSLGLVLKEMLEPAEQHPALIERLLARCLEKDREDRWQTARDLKAELEWAADEQSNRSQPASVAPKRSTWLPMAALAFGVVLAGGIAWMLLSNRSAAPPPVLNASLLPPADTSFRFARNGEGGFALSPDGTRLAFIGRTEGKAQLWVRSLGESESRLLPGSEGAWDPFWSPDSRWIAFFTPRSLKKIEIANGAVINLGNMGSVNEGSWSPRGVILLGRLNVVRHSNHMPPVFSAPDAGGSPVPVPGTAGSDPHFLPDGRRFIYVGGGGENHDLWLASLDPREKPRRIGETGAHPTYSAGHILSVVNGILMARPFDLARGELTGEWFPLMASLASRIHFGTLLTDFSANVQGMLVYPPQTNSLTELRWRDRTGKQLGSLGAPGGYYTPRISPDGRRVAFTRRDGNNSDIWVANADANSFTRLTFDPGIDEHPVWSPDGAAVTFANDATGHANLYRKAASGAGTIDRLPTNDRFDQEPLDWSRDGRFLLYTQLTASTEIMVLDARGGEPLSFLGHALGASKAQFNPGKPRWIAYDYDDSGRREIYVQAFEPGKPAASARWQISDAGGMMPRWRSDGKEIFYLSLDGKMMAVRVSGDSSAFQSSTPQFLFNATPPHQRTPNFEYDVSADGERFLMIEPMVKPEYQPLTLVSNWRLK